MAGKPLKKSSIPGVSIRQLVEEIPEGCSMPDFKQKPVTLALQEGKNATFRAVVCGEPRPEVHWKSTTGDLSNSSKYQISAPGCKEHVLQINKLTGEDSDLYRCIAVNVYGEATCSARLTVIEVGFRKNRKRQKERQEDFRKELLDFRKMLKKRAPTPAPEKKMESEQVWQLLMTADRKDYERICMQHGIVDFRGMLRKLQEMKKEREDRISQYVNAISNMRHIRVTKDGVATFDLELDLKDIESKIYLYKDHEMIPYGFDNETKHCLRRLGKRYNFQIHDLRPEDAGLYQVMVEDAVVFSTQLDAGAIPPRVVIPLAEARCEELGDAVFECTLSNHCPNAAWNFQHRPLQLSDKYEVFVSPDGLTHRLVVKGARFSDMGLYSLDTGLHYSSAWLVVEAGKDKDLQTTDTDLQLQTPGALASDAEDSRGFSGKRGKSREQGSLQGTGLASVTQLMAGPDKGGFGSHGYPVMGDEGPVNSVRGSGQEKKGFLEAERDRVTLPGDNQPHQEGDWGGSFPGRHHFQGEDSEPGLGFRERQWQDHGRDGPEDRSWGTAGAWESGSSHFQDGRLGSSREELEPREGKELNRHGQGQLWAPSLGAGAGQEALWGPQSDADQSLLKGEGIKSFQDTHMDEMEGEDGLIRERGTGVLPSRTHLWEAGGSKGAGSPGIPEFPGRRGSSSKAGTSPESWGSQGGGDADHGKARGYWESGEYPGHTSASSDTHKSSLSGDRKLLEHRRPEANAGGSPQRTGGQGPGTVVGETNYKTGPRGTGDPRDWEGSLQEPHRKDGQGTAGAWGRTGEGSRSLQSPQSSAVGQRRTGGPSRTGSESTGPQDGTWSSFRKMGVPGSGGEEVGVDGFQAARLMESGLKDARNVRLVISPGLSGDAERLRDPGAIGSKPDFFNGSKSSRENGPRGEMCYKNGSGCPGRVESRDREGLGCSKGMGPRNGAAYHDGSRVLGETGVGRGTDWRVASGASVETVSEGGSADRHGSGAPGGLWSGNKCHCGPEGNGSGTVGSLRNASRGSHGMPMSEAWKQDAFRDQGQIGSEGEHYLDGGLGQIVGSVDKGGLKGSGTTETVGEEHVEIEPGDPGRIKSWSQTRDHGDFRALGTLGMFEEGSFEDVTGVPGVREPGSLGTGGKQGDGNRIRVLGDRASGAGNWDDVRHPRVLYPPPAEAGSESHWAPGSGITVGYGDGSEIQESGGIRDRTAYGGGSKHLGPGRTGSEGEAGFTDSSGGFIGMRPEGEVSDNNGIGGSGVMGPGNKKGYKDGLGTSEMISLGSERGYRGDLEHIGDILSHRKEGFRDTLGGAEGMGSENEVCYRRGSGSSGEIEPENEMQCGDGSSRFGGPGSLAGLKHKSGPRDHKAIGSRSGYLSASEKGTNSKDGVERGGGKGLTDGAGFGVGSKETRVLGTSDGMVHRDSSTDPAMLVIQGGPQTLSGGQGTKGSLGSYGPSGFTEALGAIGSVGKPGVREWQNGSGMPGSPRDRGTTRGELGSQDQARAMGTSRFLDGKGTVEGKTWARVAALASGHDWDFEQTGSGTTDSGRVAGQQEGGNLLLEGRRRGSASGSSSETDQMVDSSCICGGQAKSMSRPDSGQGVIYTWIPDWKDQGLDQGSSRVSSSLQENDATFRQSHEDSEGYRGGGCAPGQEATDEYQGPWAPEGRGSGLERGRAGGAEDLGVLGKGKSTVYGGGVIQKPGASGPQGAWNELDGPLGRKGSGGESGGIQGPGYQLGIGQGGATVSFQEWGSLKAEIGEAQGSVTPKKYEGQGTEDSGWSGRKPDPLGNWCQAQVGTEVGSAKRVVTEGTRGRELSTGNDNQGPRGGAWCENGSLGLCRRLGSRRGAKVGRSDICGQEQTATQSPRSRYKPGTDSSSTEAPGPVGHFSQGLANTTVALGEVAMFSCILTSDLGPGTWFKDGVKLTVQDGAIFEQDGHVHRLIITHVEGTHAGKYSFIAGNQYSEASLTVQGPPTIAPDVTEKLRKPLVVKAGNPVTMKIPFQSHLTVQATWRKDGDEMVDSSLKGAQLALGDGYTRLCLPSVGRKDSGQYSVMLRSTGGCVQAEFTLQVIDKPQPPQGPLEMQNCHRAGVCLRWQPPKDDGGRPVEHYMVERRQAGRSTWLKVGESPPDSTTFTDGGVEQGRKYAFRVRAVTSEGAGDALESEKVLVAPEALPGPPSIPTILSASSQSITLTWGAPQGPDSAHILGYVVEKRKKGSNTWTAVNKQPVPERKYTVADVRQGCQYEFRVMAVAPSGHGEPGPPSDAVFARDSRKPPGLVRNLQITDASNTSITLSWMGPDTQDGDEAQGYVVELCGSDSLQWIPCHVGTVTGTTFTAKGLRPQEGYLVRVIAVNDGGYGQPTTLDSLVHTMPVTVYPKFLMDSSTNDALMVRAGDTIRVPVSFEAIPVPEVIWLKDGLPLPKRSVTTTKDGFTQLLIPAASRSDSGRYTVVLRSRQGKETAYSFVVNVAACPQMPGPIYLKENVPGTVTAQWEPSPDEAQGIPLHYTVQMHSSSHSTWREVADHVHTNRFTLLDVLPGQEYHFRVVAKNELGSSNPSDTSQPWYIPRHRGKFTMKAPTYREPNLSQKPRFLVGLRAHLLPQGCECRMTCAVQGSPKPRVTWFKNDQSLEGNPAMYSTDMLGVCSLVIPSVSPKDSGEYKAVAENPLGQAVSRATLIVTESSS